MNLAQFKNCLTVHKEYYHKIDKLMDALDVRDHIEIGDDLANCIIETLEDYFQDKSEWISYWLYELNYGDSYEDGMITDVDGTNIKLKTIEDLYNLLMENMNEN